MPRLQSSNKQRPYGRSGMSDGIARDTRPYWNLAHYDLRFWVGMVFMFAALALLPHG